VLAYRIWSFWSNGTSVGLIIDYGDPAGKKIDTSHLAFRAHSRSSQLTRIDLLLSMTSY